MLRRAGATTFCTLAFGDECDGPSPRLCAVEYSLKLVASMPRECPDVGQPRFVGQITPGSLCYRTGTGEVSDGRSERVELWPADRGARAGSGRVGGDDCAGFGRRSPNRRALAV